MLTETLSGKCPCCNYDKLLQRYGSDGYFVLDGCSKCGFGYGSNHYPESNDNKVGTEIWIDYGLHTIALTMARDRVPYPEILEERLKKEGVIHCQTDQDHIKQQKLFDVAYEDILQKLREMDIDKQRYEIFKWTEKQERCDDIETTVFQYSEDEVKDYLSQNPVIFQSELVVDNDVNKI